MGTWNFENLLDFLQKGLNPLKIHERFNFEFVPEFITLNSEGIGSGAKKESCSFSSYISPSKY
jgi:hypothetical protein